jgi:hypothetical protein
MFVVRDLREASSEPHDSLLREMGIRAEFLQSHPVHLVPGVVKRDGSCPERTKDQLP